MGMKEDIKNIVIGTLNKNYTVDEGVDRIMRIIQNGKL